MHPCGRHPERHCARDGTADPGIHRGGKPDGDVGRVFERRRAAVGVKAGHLPFRAHGRTRGDHQPCRRRDPDPSRIGWSADTERVDLQRRPVEHHASHEPESGAWADHPAWRIGPERFRKPHPFGNRTATGPGGWVGDRRIATDRQWDPSPIPGRQSRRSAHPGEQPAGDRSVEQRPGHVLPHGFGLGPGR